MKKDLIQEMVDIVKELRPLAYKLTNNPEDTKDLQQDTIVKAIRFKDGFTEGTNLKGWLSVIMRNTFINDFRLNKRLINKHGRYVKQKDKTVLNQGELDLKYNDISSIVNSINNSNTKYIKCFYMYASGYQYDEIAELSNIPIGTVKSRIHYIRKEMIDKLKEVDYI